MLFVKLTATFQCAAARQEWKETLSCNAIHCKNRFNVTHAIHLLVDLIVNAAKSTAKECARVFLDLLEALQHAGQNASRTMSALSTRLALTRNVEILALEPVE